MTLKWINSTGNCLSLALALALALIPQQGWAADAVNGSRLAHRWCEACHIVSPTQHRSGSDMAPPFATIAKRPGNSASHIALFLLDPHPKMPDMSLSRTEAADLAAYIASLAR
ncbi:MAG TPA: c-type cytochrome [Xanthobacteraceae bacterium]|jgi:mono/diheme cytochrome c family protein|nr:c-type cytochrome [Xanthobacteraceae bacterium]